ncbi:MAG: nucleotidyltransferase domain-containing protein [Rhizobiales bacterium]|nr:nucleotidyltransferase domain-containing protein [Hyphomicrobiales bacterium]
MTTNLDMLSPEAKSHLAAFKREVEEAFPGKIARVTLFGSRARGDAEEDSDYDVAVVVHERADDWRLSSLISNVAYPHMLEGVYISPIVLPTTYLGDDPPTELAAEIARDGVVLP